MRHLRALVAVTLAAALGALAVGALLNEDLWLDEHTRRAIEIERSVVELHLAIKALDEPDEAEVDALIHEMAALDPDHPKPYLETALSYNARGQSQAAAAAMDALGAPDGPGRLYGRGLLHAFRKKHDLALPDLEDALDAYRRRGHLAGQATCLTAIGRIHLQRKNTELASQCFDAVPPLLRKLRNRLDLTDAHANLAVIELQRGRPELAVRLLRDEVVSVRQELGDRDAEARGWRALGKALEAAGDTEAAIEAHGRALALRREIGPPHAVVTSVRTLADCRHAAGDTPGAIADLDEAVKIARALGETATEARALQRRGELELAVGRSRDALESFELLAGLHERAGKTKKLAEARSWIASALNRLGERERARRILDEVVVGARERDDRQLEAAALTELGVSLFYAGDLTGALLTQQNAMILNRELDNKAGMLTNQSNLAAIHYSIGDPRALDAVRMALQLAGEIGDRAAMARTHNNLGVVLLEPSSKDGEPDPEGARRELETAVRMWRSLGDALAVADTEGNLAESEARVGELTAASRRAERALEVFEREGDPRGQARLLNVLGRIRLLQGRTSDSIDAHGAALAIALDLGLHDKEWRALAGLSEAFVEDGRQAEATEHALLALDAVERTRAGLGADAFKIRYLATRLDLYERAIGLVLDDPDMTHEERATSSFEIADRARGRGLLDLIAEGRSALRDRMPDELRAREEQVLDKLNAAALRLASAGDDDDLDTARGVLEEVERAFEHLQAEIRRTVPDYAELAYPVPASAARVQGTLGADEILLEYFVGRESSWAWTVDRDGVTVNELSRLGEDWEREIAEMLADFSDPAVALIEEPTHEQIARRLASLLLPELPSTDDAARLIFVPDGALNAFPFELFPIGDGLLIERYEIGITPSASTFATLRERSGPPADSPFLGIGAPVVSGEDLPALPFARQALERIGRLFDVSEEDLLLGENATKAALRGRRLESYRIIHFATHGIPYDDLGASGLLLSGEAHDPDILLTLREIPGLDLSADLVVLSSCSSGSGENLGGEGLVNLTRAFLNAGARAVLVSLWDVSDDSTADFMESFYRGILDGRSPATALRQVKLDFLHSDHPARRLPIRWAPFILVGEPDATLPSNRNALTATVLKEGD